MNFKYAVALTGSIATGKSTVANILKENGFNIIDADKIAHKILDREYLSISKIFGRKYITDKKVDRKKLGELIFQDKLAKAKLEKFIHPLIYKDILNMSKKLDEKAKPYIIDIPLFFETNRYDIDKVIVVYTPKNIQLKRLINRDNLSEFEAQSKINSQIDIEKKRKLATYLIDNSKDLKNLQKETLKIIDKIRREFKY